MNRQSIRVSLLVLALMFVAPLFLCAEPAKYSLALTNSYRLWLEGDSSLHKYESEATVIKLETAITLDQSVDQLKRSILTEPAPVKPEVGIFEVTIPIEKMNGSKVGLATRLHSTLKYKKFPDIVYTLTSYTFNISTNIPEQINITALGRLAMSGKTNDVTLTMTAVMKGNVISVTGQKALLMSDFGVKPPKLLMIKTDDKVVGVPPILWRVEAKLI